MPTSGAAPIPMPSLSVVLAFVRRQVCSTVVDVERSPLGMIASTLDIVPLAWRSARKRKGQLAPRAAIGNRHCTALLQRPLEASRVGVSVAGERLCTGLEYGWVWFWAIRLMCNLEKVRRE